MGYQKSGNGVSIPRPTGVDRLTDAACRRARSTGAGILKLSDGKGLYLAVLPSGAKTWRLKFSQDGKEKLYTIGEYPEISLSAARNARSEAREWIRQGLDPTEQKRFAKTPTVPAANTFSVVAAEWLGKQHISEAHRLAQEKRISDLTPELGSLPVDSIGPADVLRALKPFEDRGALEMGAKARRMLSQVFRYAAATGRASSDPAALIRGAMPTPKATPMPTVPLREAPALFEAISKVECELSTRLALHFVVLTACRTAEVRGATWRELDGTTWAIPGERMKMDRDHLVPLSRQAQAVIERAAALRSTGEADELLFPGFNRSGRAGPLSENAILYLLYRAGYHRRQSGHGFRSMFSTWANEVARARPDVVEAALAHHVAGVRGRYMRSVFLGERRELLQQWADQVLAWGLRLP